MHVALFTHTFLEPTHHAIAQIIRSQKNIKYTVFAKRFWDQMYFNIPNIVGREFYNEGFVSGLESYGFDLVHAIYDGKTAINAAMNAFESEIPFILSFHGGFDTNSKIFQKKYYDKTREIVQLADVVTVPSKHDILQLRKIGVTRKINILPVPIDKKQIDIKVNPQKGKLVIVSRLVPKKGVDIGIKALSMLSEEFELVVIGDGPEKVRLQILCQRYNLQKRVAWRGLLPLKSMLEELAFADILIHPAVRASDGNDEGTPQIILWAQAIGVPVITTNTGGIEQIVEDGVTGIIVHSGNPSCLAKSIDQLSKDNELRLKITDKAKHYARLRHSLSSVSEKLSGLYNIACSTNVLAVKTRSYNNEIPSLDVVAPKNFQDSIKSQLKQYLNTRGGGCVQDYKLKLEPFAQGGQSVLFRIYLNDNKTNYLLKMPDFNSFDESNYGLLCHNIIKEARALQEIERFDLKITPRIFLFDDDGKFLLRELFDGYTLSEYLSINTSLSSCKRYSLLLKLLQFAKTLFEIFHESQKKPYVIRDFKPKNIVLTLNGDELKSVDVGSVKLECDMVIKSSRKQRIGTGHWLFWAPEQLLNDGNSMNRSVDYFALGATAYYLIYGSPPYTNDEPDRNKLMIAYFNKYEEIKNRLLFSCNGLNLDESLRQFIIDCLHPNIMGRPKNFMDIIQYIEQ